MEPNIEYIDMPEHLRKRYQYYTQADMSKFHSTGCPVEFCDVETGVKDYVQNHLDKDFLIY